MRPAPSPPLAPLGRRLKQRVARGREPIDARLDLHGMNAATGARRAAAFPASCPSRRRQDRARRHRQRLRKSSGSAERDADYKPGVLKRQVPMWLALPEFRLLVVGFDDAHVVMAAQAALYVRLRRGN